LYRLLVAERQALDAVIARLASGQAPAYRALNARSRAAGQVQHGICRRRRAGELLRASALFHIEEAVSLLDADEADDILEALASCRAGCRLPHA
jgi:hypothetical protein